MSGESSGRNIARKPRGRRKKTLKCPLCSMEVAFVWTCTCGFAMCQPCNDENAWGLTCNGITWTCPDCGRDRSY